MEDKINQALVQLENELQGIVSAREQVEKTVKSSTDLQKVVGEYVSSVKTLCVGLQSWESDLRSRGTSLSSEFESAISNLNSTCSDIINTFDTNAGKLGSDFKTKTNDTITKFVEQNKKLSEKVLELNTLREGIQKAIDEIAPIKESLTQLSKDLKKSQKEQDIVLDEIKKALADLQPIKQSLSQVSKDLKDTQKVQDAVLEEIKQKITEVPATIKGYTDSIIEKIDAVDQGLKTTLDNTNTKIDLLNEKADNLKNSTTQLLSALQSSSDTISNAISSSKEETAKSINTNRWIIIIGIIILAALQYVLR